MRNGIRRAIAVACLSSPASHIGTAGFGQKIPGLRQSSEH